jgi:hypothetical protein
MGCPTLSLSSRVRLPTGWRREPAPAAGADLRRRAGLRVAGGYWYSVGRCRRAFVSPGPRRSPARCAALRLARPHRCPTPRAPCEVNLARYLLEQQVIASALIPAIHA